MKVRIIHTNDKRPWTEHKARNIGARAAKGNNLFMIDVDYAIPKETIMRARDFTGDRMDIKRHVGVLNEHGDIKYDEQTLTEHGFKPRWIRRKFIPGHRSQFVMRKDLFWGLGGYNEALDGQRRRTGGAGEKFWRKWQRNELKGKVQTCIEKLLVYVLPDARWCR